MTKMNDTLRRLQTRNGIERYCVQDDDGERLVVDIWMNGTSYIDEAVNKVRKDVEAAAREENRCVDITIAAILECFEVENGEAHRSYHQSVDRSD